MLGPLVDEVVLDVEMLDVCVVVELVEVEDWDVWLEVVDEVDE